MHSPTNIIRGHWLFSVARQPWFRPILLAALLNAALLVAIKWRADRADPSLLDSFQFIHSHPILDDAFVDAALAHQNPRDNAVVTSLYTDAYAVPVATLGESLNRVNSTARRIVFYLPDRVSDQALCIASSTGFELVPVPRIDPPAGRGVMGHFIDQFTKLSIWNFDTLGVRALVYLDADTLVRRNFDELFALPFTLAAVPDVDARVGHRAFSTNVNAGVLFVRPNASTFRELVAKIRETRFDPWMAEQAFLNVFYGPQTTRLPFVYNGNLAIKLRAPEMWESMREEMRVVHFTVVKPFWRKADYDHISIDRIHEYARAQARERGGVFEEEIMWWDQMWRDTEDRYWRELRECRRVSSKVRIPHTGS